MALRSHPTHHTALDHDAADLRELTVFSRRDDEKVGTVDDVLADETGHPRYLSLALEGGDGRRVLMPIGQATIDHDEERLWVDCDRGRLGSAPDYLGDPAGVDSDYERRVARTYDQGYEDHDYYERPDFRGRGWGNGRSAERRGDAPRLAKVDRLDDIGVASDDPDPRGWTVVGYDGRELGEVEYLLGDLERMKVAYLVVEVDEGLFGSDRRVLVPAGHAELDTDDRRVVVRALDQAAIGEIQPYEPTSFDRPYEDRLLAAYDLSYTGERRYQHPRYRRDRQTVAEPAMAGA